ncbi:MAG: hypothetical protein ACRDRX_01980 [Pseudonocardiaceae bacterium]
MIIEIMCRIADGPLRPGELEVTQVAVPLVSWSVNSRDGSEAWDLPGNDLAIELHFPDSTVWTGEVYPMEDIEPELPSKVHLRGTGPLSENSMPLHAEVVMQRIRAMSPDSPD